MTQDGEIINPEPIQLPPILKKNMSIGGKTWLAGSGSRKARVMFVTPVVLEEEAAEQKRIGYDRYIPRVPVVGESAHWSIFKRCMERNGIRPADCFFVPIIRYLPDDQKHWTAPTKAMFNEAMPLLEADIRDIRPDIIVCLGKKVFDQLTTMKMKESEIIGGWFFSKQYNARIYPMASLLTTKKPDKHERFEMDLRAVKQMLDTIDGVILPQISTEYLVIRNAGELLQLVNRLRSENQTLLSVDCEWHGHQHVDGKLRSLQICWEPGKAAYIRFMDDQLNYVFGVDYKTAGKILGTWLNQPQVKYIGHHLSVDLAWMAYWLGLEWMNKGVFDTEFTLQCCDESLDLGLDILALRYTTFGKYDLDLIRWKKQHSDLCKEGYGYIPDEIMFEYGCRDVDCVMRAYKPIKEWLERQNLVTYYDTILNPLVTNVFVSFTLTGLPVNLPKMDEMRQLYQWAKNELEKEFRKTMTQEAEHLLKTKLFAEFENPGEALYYELFELVSAGEVDAARKKLLAFLPANKVQEFEACFEHYVIAPSFNIRSKPQMQRWLFDVKKYIPVKSTANKSAGMPSISWEKVLTYPPAEQARYTPASDKATLEILAARYSDKTITALLELNAVGNVCKAFLKEAEKDDDGELIQEQGLHYWVASDEAIHGMASVTETGRIRSWNPNSLNWPSYLSARLAAGMLAIIKKRNEQNQLPPLFQKYVGLSAKAFPTIRSIVMARPGWVIVEADYQTAEMRGLAYIAGDQNLLDIIQNPDSNFALVKPEFVPEGVDPGDCVCRLKFPDYITNPPDKDKYLMTYTVNGEVKGTFTEDMLQRNFDGTHLGPRFDVHWGAVEMAQKTAREVLDKKRDRGAGKVANFCISASEPVICKRNNKVYQVPIYDIQPGEEVFDGEEFVECDGAVYSGIFPTRLYKGLRATAGHEVFTAERVKKRFTECIDDKDKLWTVKTKHIPYYKEYDYHYWHPDLGGPVYFANRHCYDILNAGPNHRYVANGVVVGNSSSYGASPTSIERKIEADIGHKPPEGTGQALLDAIEARQPRATEFFKAMEQVPKEKGYLRAASGRIRHCHVFANDIDGLSVRDREGVTTALGRECRNFF